MMEMAHFSNVADLDRLISNIEYENQQYLKLIEKEGQQIAALEKDIEENKRTTEIIQDSVTQLDENTKRSHKQFTQNRDNCESLKKSFAILKDHEEALEKKLSSVIEKGKQESAEREDIMNHYRNILLDYEARYKLFPLAKVLEEKNQEVADLESQVMENESNIQQLKSKIQQFEEMENEDYHIWNKFVIKIAELKINTENLKKQELLLHQENKDINQKIDLARKKLLKEKAIQKNKEKEESMNKTEENIEDNIPKEVDTDTSLNDINIDIEQSDDEESTMISMYAGKEEAPDISRINQESISRTSIPEISATCAQHVQSNKYPNISAPHRVKTGTCTGTGVQANNQVKESLNETISHIFSMNSMEMSSTRHENSNNETHNPSHSTAVTQDRQVPQVFRSGPRLISHKLVSSPQACFKSPAIPVMASPRPSPRLNIPNLTVPKMTKPDKRQVSIPPPSSSLRPLVNTTAKYQHSIMSPQPYQPPKSPHVPALQHKQHTVNTGRSFQVNNNVPSLLNQNVTKSQISATQPFIKPRDGQVSSLFIPKSPRVPPVNKKKSPPESPVVSHTLQNQVLPTISEISQSPAMQLTRQVPLPQNRTSTSSIPVPVQQANKSSPIQQNMSNGTHKSTNNGIPIGTPQQTEKLDVTPQTPSPDVAVPMDTSPSPSSSNSKTPEHRMTGSPTSENWSPFNFEKHHQKLTELKGNKSPGVHLFDKRPMFNHSDDGKTSNKEEDFGLFMTSFFKSSTDSQKGGDFMMGSGDATEMTLFGRGGTGKFFGGTGGLTSPDVENTSSSQMSSGFNFGSSQAENESLKSMFGCEGNSSSETTEKETSFSFSFGGEQNTNDGSENISSLTSLFGCSGKSNQSTEDKGFSFNFGGEGNVNSPQTHGFSLF